MSAAGLGWKYGDSTIPESAALQSVKLCVDLGIDVNAANEKNQTALHGAADRGADEIVQFLAASGAKLDVKDSKGMTPLTLAAGSDSYGHPGYPTTEALLRKLISGKN